MVYGEIQLSVAVFRRIPKKNQTEDSTNFHLEFEGNVRIYKEIKNPSYNTN
jgi:hypothetical protein